MVSNIDVDVNDEDLVSLFYSCDTKSMFKLTCQPADPSSGHALQVKRVLQTRVVQV